MELRWCGRQAPHDIIGQKMEDKTMTEDYIKEPGDRECGVKTWSGSCQHGEYQNQGEKYLCSTCGKVDTLHEMHHEHFPHLSGDVDDMS